MQWCIEYILQNYGYIILVTWHKMEFDTLSDKCFLHYQKIRSSGNEVLYIYRIVISYVMTTLQRKWEKFLIEMPVSYLNYTTTAAKAYTDSNQICVTMTLHCLSFVAKKCLKLIYNPLKRISFIMGFCHTPWISLIA